LDPIFLRDGRLPGPACNARLHLWRRENGEIRSANASSRAIECGRGPTIDISPNCTLSVGFDQAAGDRIHLTTDSVTNALAHSTSVNGGLDTLITLSNSSTILLKFVSHMGGSFYS
jgi:hypothetical protein